MSRRGKELEGTGGEHLGDVICLRHPTPSGTGAECVLIITGPQPALAEGDRYGFQDLELVGGGGQGIAVLGSQHLGGQDCHGAPTSTTAGNCRGPAATAAACEPKVAREGSRASALSLFVCEHIGTWITKLVCKCDFRGGSCAPRGFFSALPTVS